MKTQKLILPFTLVLTAGLAGCESPGLKHWTEKVVAGQPTLYPQDQAVTFVKPFSVKIERCYWAGEFGKPGYESVPAGMRDQFLAKPNGKFLVVELSITNLGDQPVNWRPEAPPVFLLRNAKGSEYAPVGQDINMEDITGKIVLAQAATINPQMALRGKKVFDVPKDDYLLAVSQGRWTGGWNYVKGSTLWTWGLLPSSD